MATTNVPIQKPSDKDILHGLHHALNAFLQADDFNTVLRQSLITLSELTNSNTTFLFQIEHESSSDDLSIEGAFMLVKEADEFISLAFDYRQLYNKEAQQDKKWLKRLLEGKHIIAHDKKFAKEWQTISDQLELQLKSFILFPLMVKGRMEAILGLGNDLPKFAWSETQLLAMNTFVATFANAIARQKAEEKIKHQRDFLFQVIDSIPSPVFTKNRKGEFSLVNQAMADFYGIQPKELLGETGTNLGHSESVLKQVALEDKQIFEEGKTLQISEKRLLDSRDQLRVLSIFKTPLRDKEGEITEALCLAFDITEQKLIEDRLQESHRFRKHLASLLPLCILLIDLPTRTVIFSNHTHFMGYKIPMKNNTAQELINFLRPDDNKNDWEQYLKNLQNKSDKHIHKREYQVRHHKMPKSSWVSELSRVFKRNSKGKVLQYLVVLQDISAAKIALKAEAEAKERYQNFIRYGIEGIYFVSCQPGVPTHLPVKEQVELYYKYAVIEECNESMANMYGLESPQDFIGLRVYDMHKGESWEQNRLSVVEFVENGYRVNENETIEIGFDGLERHFINRGVGVIEDNKLVGIWGVQQEISEKRRAEKALLDSELKLNNIIEAANIGLWEWNVKTDHLTFNAQSAKILGLPEQEVSFQGYGEKYAEHIHPADFPLLQGAFLQHYESRDPFYEMEFRVKAGPDKWKWTYMRGRIVSWDEQEGIRLVRGTFIDIDDRKRSELLLRENEALMNSLFNNGSLGIKFIDKNEVIFQANQRYCDIMQVLPDEVIGRNAFHFNLPEHRPGLRIMLQEAITAGKEELIFEKQFIRSDHRIAWAKVTLNIIRNEDQSLKYVIALLEDITDKRKGQQALRESKELLEAALQTLPDLKFRMDTQGCILEIYATEHDISFFGMPSDQVIGKRLDNLLPLFAAQGLQHNAKIALASDEVQKVALLVPNNGEVQHYEARMNAINENEVIVVVRDVTENMLTEQELYETIHKMELSNRKLQSYIDSNLQLENFAYIASHDLREPVRTMRTFAQIIDKRYRDKLDEDGQTYLNFVINSADQMNQLIMDLLAYSRINSEETESVEIDTGALLRDIVSNLSQSINENQVDITTQNLPDTIQGSPTKLKQLFQNLIVNAIKFRHPERDPVIRISCKSMINHWQFSVVDNGIGIKPEFFEVIFALFKRLHSRKDYQGTGLGLAICKKIVEQHGGEIWVESEPDQGATFSFTIRK